MLINCIGALYTRDGISVKCNTAFGFYIRSKKQVHPPAVSTNLITNLRYFGNQAICVYCDKKVGELIENKVFFRAYSTSYNYHSKINRRCSKGKRHERHRHHYQVYVDRMEKNYPRGRIPAARIDSAEEDKVLCRSRTPVWLNMATGNYITNNNDEKLYIAGDIHAPSITMVITP